MALTATISKVSLSENSGEPPRSGESSGERGDAADGHLVDTEAEDTDDVASPVKDKLKRQQAVDEVWLRT